MATNEALHETPLGDRQPCRDALRRPPEHRRTGAGRAVWYAILGVLIGVGLMLPFFFDFAA